MKYAGLFVGFLAVALFILPGSTAQEKKGDDAKADKKDPDPPKEKKEKKPVEEKPEHGPVIKTKIISMKQDSARDFTVEIPMPDPQKMMAVMNWSQQQMVSISRNTNPIQRAQQMYQYQMQLAQKQANETVTMKPVEVRATEKCKVRIMYPPVQYDDAGNLKKYTTKELAALKANSKLPGFPADFDLLKTGQWIELYLVKPASPAKGSTGTTPMKKDPKKKMDDDPDVPVAVPEVVMIVIWAEPMGR